MPASRPDFRSPPGGRRSAGRTLLLRGLFLALAGGILTLIGLALVHREPGPWLDSSLSPQAAAAARRALPPLEGRPLWMQVGQCETPWGECLRLRPFVNGIEVRGADCLLHLDATASGGTSSCPEQDPAGVDWGSLGAAASKWTLDAPGLMARALGAEGARALRADSPGPSPFYIGLRPGADPPWVLGMEISLPPPSPALVSALGALPWLGEKPDPRGPIDLRLILDPRTLAVTEARDLRLYFGEEAATSEGLTGQGLLFDPNPVVASGRRDLREGDAVDAYRTWVPLPRLDGSGALRGRWVETWSDLLPRAHEEGLLFSYPSIDPRFEEAMAYHHGDRALQRVDSLGFHGLFTSPLRLHLHGTSMDNSWYSRPGHEIVFGDGGVDDAEDADIILHEIGHAIHDAFVPGFGDGATLALSEGFGDFWAASLTGDPCVGDWDATSYSPPCLRQTDRELTYPGSLTGRPHLDGQIWSATLWDLRAVLGPRGAERLALAGFLEQGTSTTFPEAARGLLRAAGRIGLEAEREDIEEVLARRGLIPREIEITLRSGESRRFDLPEPAPFLGRRVQALVLDGDGRLLFSPRRATDSLPISSAEEPVVWPCVLSPSDGLTPCRIHGTIGREGILLQQERSDGALSLARIQISWNAIEGGLEWTYLDLPPSVPGSDRSALAWMGSVAPDSLREIRPEEIPLEGIGGLRAFRLLLPADGASFIGARLAISAEAESGPLRLRMLSPGYGSSATRVVLEAQPNPFRGEGRLRLFLPQGGPARVELFDVAGRRVRLLEESALPSGLSFLTWDGRDDRGRPTPAGSYWARAEAAGHRAQVRLLRLR